MQISRICQNRIGNGSFIHRWMIGVAMRKTGTDGSPKNNSCKNASQKKRMPSTGSLSTSSRRRKSDSNRRRDTRDRDDLAVEPVRGRNIKTNKTTKKKTIDEDQIKTDHRELDRDKPATPEQKTCFEQFARDTLAKGINGILSEYMEQLVAYTPPGVTRKAFDANPTKNRYSDVVCVDQTRVVLKRGLNDYIHANFVRGDPLVNIFICTQGPMMATVKDFWRMIVQEQVGNIIMLCDTIEVGKEKCQQYWPREEGCAVEWPGIQVKNTKIDKSDTTTVVSTLEVVVDRKDKFTLKHHHWRTWPDKSVPASVLAPFRVLKLVRHSSRPTVVHCSAGIGRTGSVVALEVCYQQLLGENQLSVLEMVKWLRAQRMSSVQTDLQYLYLYKCLITFACKYKLIPADLTESLAKFDEEYQRLIDDRTKQDKPELYAPLVFIKK